VKVSCGYHNWNEGVSVFFISRPILSSDLVDLRMRVIAHDVMYLYASLSCTHISSGGKGLFLYFFVHQEKPLRLGVMRT